MVQSSAVKLSKVEKINVKFIETSPFSFSGIKGLVNLQLTCSDGSKCSLGSNANSDDFQITRLYKRSFGTYCVNNPSDALLGQDCTA